MAWAAFSNVKAQDVFISQTVQVLPPYKDKLSDYFNEPNKIVSVISTNPNDRLGNEYGYYIHGYIESADQGGIRIGTSPNYKPANPSVMRKTVGAGFQPYTLTFNDIKRIFNEQNLSYQGITRQQVQQNGLPEGTYHICFKVFVNPYYYGQPSPYDIYEGQPVACSAPFRIQKKKPVINQTIQVMPPYTNKLSDYFERPGKINSVITITQYPDNEAFIDVEGMIEQVNGNLRIESGRNKASLRIKGTPSGNNTVFAPYTLTYNDLREVFKEPMRYQGITRQQVQQNGLPEGTYRICFKLKNARTGALLSQACSAPFVVAPSMLSAIEPPQIVQPIDGSELPPEQMHTLQFTWTMPPGAPANTQYMLKIIELNDRYANYRDMLRNSSYPAFFETTVTGVPTYLYTPANPAFKEGKTYAFIVRAFSPAGVAPTNFKNDGYSEPATFTFKQAVKVEPPVNVEPPKKIEPEMVDEGLKIFVPGCKNCNQYEGIGMPDIPAGGMSYRLQGDMLNPHPEYDPNPKTKTKPKGSSTQSKSDAIELNTTAKNLTAEIKIPAGALAVNNARNFYLRWEDKSSVLEKRQPKTGEGIVYHLRISDARTRRIVWEKQVWNNNSYEQTKKELPFEDKHEYILHITALRGVVTQGGFSLVKDKTGKPETLASSCECEFTYMKLPDIPDLEEYTVKGKLSYKFEKYSEKYPLVTRTATLTRYTSLIDAASKEVISDMELTSRDDRHSVPIHINEDGTFEVTFYAYPNNGLIESEKFVPGIAGKVDLYEFFNLELNSLYYSPLEKPYEKPTKTIVNLTNKVIDMGEITYNVWSYTLEVEVSKGYSKWGDSLTGSYRELNPPNVTGDVSRFMFSLEGYEDAPYYEGDIPASEKRSLRYGKGHITDGKTEIRKGEDGKEHTYVTFNRLICNFQSNDNYNIEIEQELDVKGKKKKIFTNEFKGLEEFQYFPNMQEKFDARKEGKSNFFVKRKATLLDDTPPQSTVKGRLVFADPSINKDDTKPLANTDIALVETYLIEDNNGHSTVMDLPHLYKEGNNKAVEKSGRGNQETEAITEIMNKFENRNKVLAVTRTDANGNFEFKDFARIDSASSGAISESSLVGAHEFKNYFGIDGKLRQTVRVVVNNNKKHRWLNPSNNIDIQPNASMDVGELKAFLDTYILHVKPIGDPDYEEEFPSKDSLLRGAKVKILRYGMYDSETSGVFVIEEKQIRSKEDGQFSVPRHTLQKAEDGTENTSGTELRFKYMPNDMRIIAYTSDSVGEHSFHRNEILFPRNYYLRKYEKNIDNVYGKSEFIAKQYLETPEYCVRTFNHFTDGYRFTDDFIKLKCDIKIVMKPKKPIVSGRLLDTENLSRGVDGWVFLDKMDYYDEKWWWSDEVDVGDQMGFGFFQARKTSAKNRGYFVFDNLEVEEEVKYNNPNFEEPPVQENSEFKTIKSGGNPRYLSKNVQSRYALKPEALGYSLYKARQQTGVKDTTEIEFGNSRHFPENGFTLAMGQQMHFPQILMQPNGLITGYVENEEGESIGSHVKSIRSRLIPTGENGQKKNHFSVRIPTWQSNTEDTLYVLPNNLNYFNDTIPLPRLTASDPSRDLGKIVVKKRMHRIRIVVRKKTNRPPISLTGDTSKIPGIEGVTVKIHASEVESKVTDEFGVAEFIFENAEKKNFRYELIPPDDSEYIAEAGELPNKESKYMQSYHYRLKKGATVTGKVTSDSKPVPNAEVWVMNGDNKRLVKTDSEGHYTLRGIKPVPGSPTSRPKPEKKGKAKSNIQINKSVSKSINKSKINSTIELDALKSGYIATIHCAPPEGEEEFSNLLALDEDAAFKAMDGSATVDFELEPFYKANIRTLHGFNINVNDITEDGGDAYRISGIINLDKAPGKFEIKNASDQNPRFENLKVRINHSVKDEKERPYFEVVGDNFSVGMKMMNVELYANGTADDDISRFEINPENRKKSKFEMVKNKNKTIEKSKNKLSGVETNEQFANINRDALKKLYGHTYAVQLSNEGDAFLKITKDGVTGGFIRSKARIEASSFSFTSANFTFDRDQFHISDREGGNATGQLTSFKSYADKERMDTWKKEAYKNRSYALHDENVQPLKFKFVTFDATSPLEGSRLSADGVIRLNPDVQFNNPLFNGVAYNEVIRLDLPEVRITPKQVEGDVNLDKFNMKFEKWTIEVNKCQIDPKKGGIYSDDAVIKTGKIDLYAKKFILNKDVFILDGFDPDKIPLGKDISQIDISKGATYQFGLDKKCGSDLGMHLKLSLVGNPAGSIKGLPGFEAPVGFQMISLISNGEEIISFAPDSKSMRLYDVVDFYPLTINSYDDAFSLDGTLDFGIPRIPKSTSCKLMYTKTSKKKLNMGLFVQEVGFDNVGTFKSSMKRIKDKRIIKDGLVKLHGTIHEDGELDQIRVVVWKKRTAPNKYDIWMDLEDRDKPDQFINLGGGGTDFRVAKADMKILPDKNDWDFLRLKLVPEKAYGDKSGFGSDPLYFELGGELRTDLNIKDQQIKMVGTDRDPQKEGEKQDGFMGFSLVYDHPRRELRGDMTIEEKNVAGVKFSGDLHIAIGQPGFYFMGAGMFQVSPFGKINAGILLGYYDKKIPTHIWNDILKYSARNEVPCSFTGNSFRGFYALGSIGIPFANFDYSFDVPGIALGGVKLDVGAEASVYGSFQPGKNELGFSAMIFAEAAAYLHAVTCTSISAKAKATIKGEASLMLNKPYTARLTVCGDVAFGGCLEQGLPTLVGGCIPILSLGKSFAFHIGCTGEIDLKGDSSKPCITETSLGKGKCTNMKGSCHIGVIKDDPCGDWEEDEDKVKEIKEQQKREQEEQQKKQQNK